VLCQLLEQSFSFLEKTSHIRNVREHRVRLLSRSALLPLASRTLPRRAPKKEGSLSGVDQTTQMGSESVFQLCTFNVRSLLNPVFQGELEVATAKIHYDIIALTSLRLPQEGRKDCSSGPICFHSGRLDNTQAGVGFFVSRRMKKKILRFESISPRLAFIDIVLSPSTLVRVIVVYAPTSAASREEHEDFDESLVEVYGRKIEGTSPAQRTFKIVTGDFNAIVGGHEEGERSVGKFGLGERNERGQDLVDLCESLQLRVGNTFLKKRKGRKWTWKSPNGETHNEIDYILVDRYIRLQDVDVVNRFDFDSDHRLLRAVVGLPEKEKQKRTKKRRTSKVLKRSRLDVPLFRYALEKQLEERTPLLFDGVIEAIQTAAIIGAKEEPEERRFSEKTAKLLQERNRLKPRSRERPSIEYREICKATRASWKLDIEERRTRRIEKAVREQKNLKKAVQDPHAWRGGTTALRKNDGQACRTREETAEVIKSFYDSLYASRTHVAYTRRDETEEMPVVLPAEVAAALRTMKRGKAPGEDGVTTDMLRAGSDLLVPIFTSTFNSILDGDQLPAKFADSRTLLLFEKGDPTDIANYRPISLLPTTGKLFTKVLDRRFTRSLDEAQAPEQSGFRPGHSTIDAIHTVNQVIAGCREYRLPLYLVFIDLKKAFDSVEFNAVLNALEQQGIPQPVQTALQKTFEQARSVVTFNNEEIEINIQRGVRQGDSLSPKLFNACFEQVFRLLHQSWSKKGINIDGRRLSHLRFADDVVLFSHDCRQLQTMLNQLEKKLQAVGLQIHPGKTEAMTNRQPQRLLIGGQRVRFIDSFIYLGQRISMTKNDADVTRRIQAAWASFNRFKTFFIQKKVDMKHKRRLFNSCILPAFTYAAETWALTKGAFDRLRKAQRKMERRMIGVTMRDKKRNDWLRAVTKLKDVRDEALKKKFKWARKVMRKEADSWAKRTTEWRPRGPRRPRGRPPTRWRDDLVKAAGPTWWRIARNDSESWKAYSVNYIST